MMAGPVGGSVDDDEGLADCLSTRKMTSRAQRIFCAGSVWGFWMLGRADWRVGIVGRGAVREVDWEGGEGGLEELDLGIG